MQTRVTGPGTLTFWWAVSCEGGGNDALRLLVGGSQVKMISGDVGWTKVTVPISGSGTHLIKRELHEERLRDEGRSTRSVGRRSRRLKSPIA